MNISNNIEKFPSISNNNTTRSGIYDTILSDNKTFEDLLKKLESASENIELVSENNDNSNSNILRSSSTYSGQTATDRGTKIVQAGQDMDKNAFLTILAAQMSNQDPTNPQDGTEYISQFAQFASMEQMSNLNNTMSGFASQSLIGKGVMLNAYDKTGNVITGVVRSVAQSGSKISIGVEYLDEAGELVMSEFGNSDILNVIDVSDNRLDYINNNMSMLVGSSMINKNVEFTIESDDEDIEYEMMKGRVEGVIVDNHEIKVKVRVGSTGGIEIVKLDKITKVEE